LATRIHQAEIVAPNPVNQVEARWKRLLTFPQPKKFFHTVLSGWVLGGVFVVGISCWYLLKKRNREFALASIKSGAIFGLVASLLAAWTGDGSGYQIAQTQPMKLAAWKACMRVERM